MIGAAGGSATRRPRPGCRWASARTVCRCCSEPASCAAPPQAGARAGALQLRASSWTRGGDRYLDDHRIDGRPVLPFAVAMELMGEAAAAAGGVRIAGLRDIRLLDGVSFEDDRPVTLRVDATAGRRTGRSRPRSVRPPRVVRTTGQASSRSTQASGPSRRGPGGTRGAGPVPAGVAAAYRDLLFHGPLFQGILAIEGMDERGATARCWRARSRPSAWTGQRGCAGCWTRSARQRPAGAGAVGAPAVGRDPAARPRSARSERTARDDRGEPVHHELRIRPQSGAAAVPRRPLVLRLRRPPARARSRTSSGSARRRSNRLAEARA